jgi:hypothetical protein
MILTYYHNNSIDIPNITGIEEFIGRDFGVNIRAKQFTPRSPSIYAGVTEISFNERKAGSLLDKLKEEIHILLN